MPKTNNPAVEDTEAAPKMDDPKVEASAEPEMVQVYIPKGNAGDEANLFIGINGVNYLLPKGKTSTVPSVVAKEIERALKAQEIADANIEMLLSVAPKETK